MTNAEAAAAPAHYRRLPGRAPVLRLVINPSNASSVLWLSDDHLLQVNTFYFNESFKRFAYNDIQALLLRETSRALMVNSTLGVLAAGCGLIAWSTEGQYVRPIFIGIAIFWVILLVVNLLRGQTCRCQLQTAAGPHPLPSLSRVRPARRAWQLILEKIDAAQGTLAPEDIASQMR